jgi:hypothetical protein
MHRQIGLAITVEIQRMQHDSTGYRLFEDARRYRFVIAKDQARQADIE